MRNGTPRIDINLPNYPVEPVFARPGFLAPLWRSSLHGQDSWRHFGARLCARCSAGGVSVPLTLAPLFSYTSHGRLSLRFLLSFNRRLYQRGRSPLTPLRVEAPAASTPSPGLTPAAPPSYERPGRLSPRFLLPIQEVLARTLSSHPLRARNPLDNRRAPVVQAAWEAQSALPSPHLGLSADALLPPLLAARPL
ncbi:MAG: hypothetical protein RIT28_44 [Pseudomonadota bacterium]